MPRPPAAPARPQRWWRQSQTGATALTFVALAGCAVSARADAVTDAYRKAIAAGDHAAAYRAQSFLMPPYGDDPNLWHGITVRKAVNGHVGKPAYPFTYQDMTHLKVRALYERARIGPMEKASRTELELIRRIANWANSQWGHMRPLPYATWDALEILDRGEKGDAFWCEYKAVLFVQACNAAGLTARIVGINRKDEDSHMVAEVYSNQFRKWMLVDAWWNCYYERAGVPLSAIEFHRAASNLTGIDVVFGENGKKLAYWDVRTGKATTLQLANGRAAVASDETKGLNDWYYDLHIVLRNDHTVNPQQNENAYVDGFMVPPNYRGGDWRGAQLHWVDDQTPPQLTCRNSDDISDFEWPLNEVKVDLQLTSLPGEPAVVEAQFTTVTPSFSRYDLRIDDTVVPLAAGPAGTPFTSGAEWSPRPTDDVVRYAWKLKPGVNTLKINSVNAVGRAGFPSEFVLEYDPAKADYSKRVARIALENPGWEKSIEGGNRPANWVTITSNALHAGEFLLDPAVKRSGHYALRAAPARDLKTGLEYAFIVRSDPVAVNAASDVAYSVWLKAAQDDTPVEIALSDATYKGHGTYVERVKVSREWQRYELKCRLHNELTSVWVGFKVYHGTLWADDADLVEAKP